MPPQRAPLRCSFRSPLTRQQVFGPGTNMSVGYIIAEPPTKKGTDTEAIDTAAPLAASLGLTLDTSWCAPPCPH